MGIRLSDLKGSSSSIRLSDLQASDPTDFGDVDYARSNTGGLPAQEPSYPIAAPEIAGPPAPGRNAQLGGAYRQIGNFIGSSGDNPGLSESFKRVAGGAINTASLEFADPYGGDSTMVDGRMQPRRESLGYKVGQGLGYIAPYEAAAGAIRPAVNLAVKGARALGVPLAASAVETAGVGAVGAGAFEGAKAIRGEEADWSNVPKEAAIFGGLDVGMKAAGKLARGLRRTKPAPVTKTTPKTRHEMPITVKSTEPYAEPPSRPVLLEPERATEQQLGRAQAQELPAPMPKQVPVSPEAKAVPTSSEFEQVKKIVEWARKEGPEYIGKPDAKWQGKRSGNMVHGVGASEANKATFNRPEIVRNVDGETWLVVSNASKPGAPRNAWFKTYDEAKEALNKATAATTPPAIPEVTATTVPKAVPPVPEMGTTVPKTGTPVKAISTPKPSLKEKAPTVNEVKPVAETPGQLPERTFDTMSEAIALSSPSGKMSKRAKASAEKRLSESLFGKEGLQPPKVKQPTELERLQRQAVELRGLANRGMNTKSYNKQATKLEARIAQLIDEPTSSTPTNLPKPGGSTTLGFMGANPDAIKGLGENVVKGMKAVSASSKQIIESAKTPPEIRTGIKEAKTTMVEHDRQIRRAEGLHVSLKKVVNEVVKDADRQMLMVHAYEKKMAGAEWSQLSEIEKGVVRWAGQEKRKLNEFIEENKILDVMKSEQYNHIFHHWINPESGKPYEFMYGKFSKGLPQAKQRVIPTYEAGIAKGLKPATTNLGDLIGMEWEAATRAHNSRQMFETLHNIGAAKEVTIKLTMRGKPRPIRMVERWDKLQQQGLTDGYKRMSHPALDKTMVFKDADGNMVRLKGAVGVREELYPFVDAYLNNPTYGKWSELNFASKSLKLGVSLFHPVSLGFQELANFRVPFVNIPRGLKMRKEFGPAVRLLHQEGLEVLKGYEDLGYRNSFFEGTTLPGKVGNVVTKPVTIMRDFIFNVVQPGMKISFAHDTFMRLLPKYLEGTGWTTEKVLAAIERGEKLPEQALKAAREVVQKSDGHFSGEHYKRSLLETNRFMAKLYFSPEGRKFWQGALLSPTWQREHLLVAKNVAKSFMPDKLIKKLGMSELGPIKSAYRRYALGGVMIVGAVDLWNQMSTLQMDGESKHIWENPPGKGFAVRAWWDEPDYETTDKNGKTRKVKGGPAYIRPLKSLFEVAEWVHDPIAKVSYKFSPLVSAIGEQFFDSYTREMPASKKFTRFITDVSSPIVIDQWIDVAKGKKTPLAGTLPFFGMPVSKVVPPSKETERRKIMDLYLANKGAEADKLVKEWNARYKDNQITDEDISYEKLLNRAKSQSRMKAEASK